MRAGRRLRGLRVEARTRAAREGRCACMRRSKGPTALRVLRREGQPLRPVASLAPSCCGRLNRELTLDQLVQVEDDKREDNGVGPVLCPAVHDRAERRKRDEDEREVVPSRRLLHLETLLREV